MAALYPKLVSLNLLKRLTNNKTAVVQGILLLRMNSSNIKKRSHDHLLPA
jgi:hypothetical protein